MRIIFELLLAFILGLAAFGVFKLIFNTKKK